MSFLTRLKRQASELNPLAIGVELLIVFVGVYLAFLLSQYQETRKLDDKRETVISLLADGIGRYEGLFEGFAQYHEGRNAEILAELRGGQIPDMSNVAYAAPQYPSDAIDYVLTNESFDVFELELYVPLASFANRIKQLTSVEAELTELGNRYVRVDRTSPRYAEMYQLGVRYHHYMEFRRSISADLAGRAAELLALIEGRVGR